MCYRCTVPNPPRDVLVGMPSIPVLYEREDGRVVYRNEDTAVRNRDGSVLMREAC